MREGRTCISRQPVLDEAMQARENLSRVLSGDQAEGQLGSRLTRDHGLGTGSAITADNTVDLDCRPRPELLDHAEAPFACRQAASWAGEGARMSS